MIKTEIKIKIKTLFAKAVNHGMTSKEANEFFLNTMREFQGKQPINN